MRFDFLRAHQRYLPLIGQRSSLTDADLGPPEAVQVAAAAKAFLLNALGLQGMPRGGPLFGHREVNTLHLKHANQAGYHEQITRDPMAIDPSYLLGLTDAYHQADPALDWVGQWMVWPDGQLPGQRESLYWFEVARGLHLVNPVYCLLLVGWADHQLTASALVISETTGECEWLPTTI